MLRGAAGGSEPTRYPQDCLQRAALITTLTLPLLHPVTVLFFIKHTPTVTLGVTRTSSSHRASDLSFAA